VPEFFFSVFFLLSFGVGFSTLLGIAYSDWKDYRIPNSMVLVLAAVGILTTYIYVPFAGGTVSVIMKLINTAVFLGMFGILSILKATKPGDVKLFAAACLFLPQPESVVYLVGGMVVQMLAIIPWAILSKRSYLIKEFPHALLFPIPVALSYLLWLSFL